MSVEAERGKQLKQRQKQQRQDSSRSSRENGNLLWLRWFEELSFYSLQRWYFHVGVKSMPVEVRHFVKDLLSPHDVQGRKLQEEFVDNHGRDRQYGA